MEPTDAAATNARYWDALAVRHGGGSGRFYDLEALLAGANPLWEAEQAALDRVAPDGLGGQQVLHLQCHLAANAVWFARSGARVTGLDFSGQALRLAAERADRCGVAVDWVQADAANPPATLARRFDLVWATIGVTCWTVDLDRWFAAAAGMLAPGGRLALVEIHPAYVMLDTVDSWFAGVPCGGGTVTREQATSSYDDPSASFDPVESVSASWSVADHVGAALGAGLRITGLVEHDSCEHDPRGLLTADDDGRYRLRVGPEGCPLPLLFTLLAARGR